LAKSVQEGPDAAAPDKGHDDANSIRRIDLAQQLRTDPWLSWCIRE
jgi:hypothetical protein